MPEAPFEAICATFKRASAALRDAEVRFMLGGGLAAWARGGPVTQNDLDLVVAPSDAERALAVLEQAGLRTERPPEEWLLKAYDGEVMIDLIFGPEGPPGDDAMFERADDLTLESLTVRPLAVDDLLISKLLALTEHHLDYDSLLELVRSLREQVGWDRVRRETDESPFARAFFTMAEGLGLA